MSQVLDPRVSEFNTQEEADHRESESPDFRPGISQHDEDV
jgi:hypothetical protein